MSDEKNPLPVPGYTPQTQATIDVVTANKHLEERVLRQFDQLAQTPGIDGRWLAIGRTHIEQGFMAMNRAVFKPQRVQLPENEDVERIARVAHEVNRAYCASLGDLSQPAWENAPAWQRSSAMDGVRFILANPGATPADSHDNWLREKERTGWTWGPEKDPEAKQHPCMVPYDQLPLEQRTKDYLFRAAVLANR